MNGTPVPILGAAAALLVFAGCDSNPVATLPDISGTYALVEVGGEPLPVIFHETDRARIEVISGFLNLAASHTYSESVTVRFTDKVTDVVETVVETDEGSFSVTSATSVTFTSENPEIGSHTATIDGDDISYMVGETQITYRR